MTDKVRINEDRYDELIKKEYEHTALRAAVTGVRDDMGKCSLLDNADTLIAKILDWRPNLTAALYASPSPAPQDAEPGICAKCGTTEPGLYMDVSLCLACYEGHNDTPPPGIDPAAVRALRDRMKSASETGIPKVWRSCCAYWAYHLTALLDGPAPQDVPSHSIVDALEHLVNTIYDARDHHPTAEWLALQDAERALKANDNSSPAPQDASALHKRIIELCTNEDGDDWDIPNLTWMRVPVLMIRDEYPQLIEHLPDIPDTSPPPPAHIDPAALRQVLDAYQGLITLCSETLECDYGHLQIHDDEIIPIMEQARDSRDSLTALLDDAAPTEPMVSVSVVEVSVPTIKRLWELRHDLYAIGATYGNSAMKLDGIMEDIPYRPDCTDAPEPEPVTTPQRAAWFAERYIAGSPPSRSLAYCLAGHHDTEVRAMLKRDAGGGGGES